MDSTASALVGKAEEALRRNRADEAERLCREALGLERGHYRSLVLLAFLLRKKGEYAESAAAAERASQLLPDHVDAYLQLGLSLLATGRPDRAADALTKTISLKPNVAAFHFHLGAAYEAMEQDDAAQGCYKEALRLDPKHLQARLCLLGQLLKEEEIDEARAYADEALRIAPHSVPVQLIMADILQSQNDMAGADACIHKALSTNPNVSLSHAMLGFRLLQNGRFEEAAGAFRRSIELNPAQGFAYLGLSQTNAKVQIGDMERVHREGRLAPREASFLLFALGKAYADAGEYEPAMGAYDEAHRTRFGGRPFDQDEHRRSVDAIRQVYPTPLAEGTLRSDVPILIVGMMRSGTTLVEQILSSHPDVGAAGEHTFWQRKASKPEIVADLATSPAKLRNLAEEYVAELQRISPGTPRVTDKLPGNYLRLGLIRQALPKAKVIHCCRSGIDTALSIWVTPNGSAPSFSHSKEGVVFAYRQYLELMEHWRRVLPPSSFLDVRYEDLVSNPEPMIREMLDFCNLDWTDACLHPEQNSKTVATPSVWQVRQPIYRTSVERWRRFEPWLGALSELVGVD